MLLYTVIVVVSSFLLLFSIPLHEYATIYLFILLLLEISSSCQLGTIMKSVTV